jgi:hypothetical protein
MATTLRPDDLRHLLDSSLPDPRLVLVEGRLKVVTADDLDTEPYRGALLVVSRDELLVRTGGRPDLSDRELEQLAATLSVPVDELGG